MATDLTSLADVKAWLNINDSSNDAILLRLIQQASRAIYAYLTTNTLFLQTFNDTYDGVNNVRQYLKEWPVVSVSAVNIGGQSILAAPVLPQQGAGYRIETFNGVPPGAPQALDLYGFTFWRGRQNIYVSYTAGYAVTNEAQTIPVAAPYEVVVNQQYGRWGQDDGVVSASGLVFTAVSGTPAAGQYSVDETTGTYEFNAANANTAVLISYSYIPADVEQACIEMVGERFRYKSRIGQKTASIGGQQTASYDLGAMSAYVGMLLQSYKRTNI